MKQQMVRLANAVLRPMGAHLARLPAGPFDLSPLRRLQASGCRWNSLIDLGAARGEWSSAFLREFPSAKVLAVEPLQEQEPALRHVQAASTGFKYCLAVAGETDGGFVELSVTPDLDGTTVGGGTGRPRQVPVRSVDSLVEQHGLPPPYFLKFDTHGFEMPILKGAERTLNQTAALVMEVYNFAISPTAVRFPVMCQHLEGLGFRCCDLSDPVRRPGDQTLWQMDLWFRRANDAVFKCQTYTTLPDS